MDRSDSFLSREGAFVNGLEFFENRPVFGYGPGEIYVRFLLYTGRNESFVTSADDNNELYLSPYNIPMEVPHSFLIDILAENGVFGFIAFFGVIGLLLLRISRLLCVQADALCGGVAISVLVFIGSMLFANFNNIMEEWICFWFLVGIMLSIPVRSPFLKRS